MANLHAANYQKYTTLELTNSANLTNGITLTLGGDVRTGEDIVTNAATQFARSNRIDYATTNLYTHLQANGFTNVQVFYISGATNKLMLVGGTNNLFAISALNGWASLSNYTSQVFSATAQMAPFPENWSNTLRTAMMNMLVTQMQDYASTLLASNAAFMAHWVNLQGTQTLSNKTLLAPILRGAVAQLINSSASNFTVTNLVANGSGNNSLQIGLAAVASGSPSIALGVSATASGVGSVGISGRATADTAIGLGGNAFATGAIAIGGEASGPGSATLGASTLVAAAHTNSTAVGNSATTTADHQVRLGTASETVSVPGILDVLGVTTLASLFSTNADFASATIHTGTITGSVVTATSAADLTGAIIRSGNTTNTAIQADNFYGPIHANSGQLSNATISATAASIGALDATNFTGRGGSASNMNGSFNNLAAGSLIFSNLFGSNVINGAIYLTASNYSALGNGAATTNVVQLSHLMVTYVSGNSADASIISMLDTRGTPDAGRWAITINASSFNQTYLHESTIETVAGRRFKLAGSQNLIVSPNGGVLWWWSTTDSRWMPVATSGASVIAPQFSITGTTNQLVFGATNIGGTFTATQFVSVSITGDTNAYVLPLYRR